MHKLGKFLIDQWLGPSSPHLKYQNLKIATIQEAQEKKEIN